MPPRRRTTTRTTRPDILGVPTGDWLTVSRGRLDVGRPAKWIEIPERAAQELLPGVTRVVADLPRTGSRDVVWVSGRDELKVATGRTTLACKPGLVVITIPVACDQLPARSRSTVDVPLAVGTREQPRGLMMSTLVTPVGPAVVTDVWADSLVAFAWETLLTLVREVARASGRDRAGRALVPLAVAATDGRLLVQPMAGHAR